MNNIFVFTAGNPAARSHLDASIRNSIDKELVISSFDTSEHEALLRFYGEAEGFYAWGAVPGPQNESRWKTMTAGDFVFCVYDSTYHYVAKLLGKYDNEKLARAVWGEDENHNTWQYLYFLTKPAEVNIPIKNVANYLNEGYLGFTRIGDDKLKKITLEHKNIENFVERVFFDRNDNNAQEEFITIVKRYQEEGTVFRSATQGTRYFIQAADSAGCVVKRIDAEESERCTASLYLEKRKIIRERGGSLRFNDLDPTAAKRSTFLQARPFGLTADKETILDLSSKQKALDIFIDIIRNIKVARIDGIEKLYKPALVACVIDGLKTGDLKENIITFDWVVPRFIRKMQELSEDVSEDQAALAFFHLTNDMFWLLSYHDPARPLDDGAAKPNLVRQRVKYASIKDTFWRVLQDEEGSKAVLNALEGRWWPRKKAVKETKINVWWVNQGKTLNAERENGILWAPLKTSDGRIIYHWETMAEVEVGDIVVHYANGALRYVSRVLESAVESKIPEAIREGKWEEDGRLVKAEYHKLEPELELRVIAESILACNINQGPLDKDGKVKQGYLFTGCCPKRDFTTSVSRTVI